MGGAVGQPSPAANTKRTANNRTPGNNRRAQANNKATNSSTRVNMEGPATAPRGVLEQTKQKLTKLGENVGQKLTKLGEEGQKLAQSGVNTVMGRPKEPTTNQAPATSTPPSAQNQANTSTPAQPEAPKKEGGNSVLYYVLVGICVVIIIALIYYIYKVYFVTEKYEDKEDKEEKKAQESLNGHKDFNEQNLKPFTIDDANGCMKIF